MQICRSRRRSFASGTLAMKSGKSELNFRGRNGERLDATVSLNVASLQRLGADSAAKCTRHSWCAASGLTCRSRATRTARSACS
jgi:hypothetical protein